VAERWGLMRMQGEACVKEGTRQACQHQTFDVGFCNKGLHRADLPDVLLDEDLRMHQQYQCGTVLRWHVSGVTDITNCCM
jgi:hypothetical protein